MALTYDGTAGITFNDGSQMGSAGSLGMRNRIINGNIIIDQKSSNTLNTAVTTVTNATTYTVDRWVCGYITSGTFTIQQVSDAPAGFSRSLKLTMSTATTANDYGYIGQRIEALNALDLNWGTSSTQPCTLSFWAKSSITGTFCAAILYYNSSSYAASYFAPYTINSANTWQYITITIPGAPATYSAFNGLPNTLYASIIPFVITSSGYTNTVTPNTWLSGTPGFTVAGRTDLGSVNNATFQITGVQFEKGSVATPFEFRHYGTELALCQRYLPAYMNNGLANMGIGTTTTNTVTYTALPLPVQTRVAPTGLVVSNSAHFAVGVNSGTICGTVAFNSATDKTAIVQGVVVSGLTANQVSIMASVNANSYIYFTGCEM